MEEGSGGLPLAAICVALLVGIFTAFAILITKMQGTEEQKPEPEKKKGGAQKRRGALDRMQRGAASATGADAENEDDDDEGDENADDGGRENRRNAQKEQKKQDKKAQQQAERQMRQERDSSKSEKQSKYSQRQQEKEVEHQRKEEAYRKEKEEKERKEKEEFEKWKEMFAVEEEGQDDAATGDESAVERFIQFVKTRKVVNLDDLASEFRMKTSSVIDRLRELEKLDRISGIFDDRGKFVFITKEEMTSVADFLHKKGRISRAEVVAACNRLIRLNPTKEDEELLEKEKLSAANELDSVAQEAADQNE